MRPGRGSRCGGAQRGAPIPGSMPPDGRTFARRRSLTTQARDVPASQEKGLGPVSSTTNDKLLVKRVQQGDNGAFDLLVLKYQHKIVNLVSRYVRDDDEALDVAQEAFIKAFRALPRFRGDSAFYTWLYRIAVNTAKNYLVAARRRPMDYTLDLQDPEQYDAHARLRTDDTPEAVALKDETQQRIGDAINDLPDDLRTAIVLREIDGMSYEEIAQAMECPVGTVRSRIFRAREAITKGIEALAELPASSASKQGA